MRDGAVVLDEISGLEDLPVGWTAEQGPGHYRSKQMRQQEYFGYGVTPQSWKRFLHLPQLNLFSVERGGGKWVTKKRARPTGTRRPRRTLTAELGSSFYTRIDTPASPAQKARLQKLAPEAVRSATLGGEPITARLTRAPGNNAPIGGLKVASENGWFVARPSGTEDIVKLYAESFRDEAHLQRILDEAREIMADALAG